MNLIHPAAAQLHVLAIGTGEDGANNFLKSSIGTAVVGLCGAFGIVVAVICIMRMVKHVSGGKPGEGFKVLVFGLLIAGLLFNLNLTISGAKSMGGLVEKVFSSVTTVTG
ncbi:hypothetical protein ACRYCC_13125 [Actinomadura scrupuli]|uniref:hypothetical protein n=1 Tax=Actinomadura scrupuli TaxID=559629 RepID=UPI003D99C0C7